MTSPRIGKTINLWVNYFSFLSRTSSVTSEKERRQERVDRVCVYLRLCLGMGVIWYFDILAFALTTVTIGAKWFYFTDCLNMMQVHMYRQRAG